MAEQQVVPVDPQTTSPDTSPTTPLYKTMTITVSLAPASQIQTFKHPEFQLIPLSADPKDPKGYNKTIYSFETPNVLSAKQFIDSLNSKHIPHCSWTDPITPCRPRKRSQRKRPLAQWREMVTIFIFPEVLTPNNATIVLMIPSGNAKAGNVLWIFPKTMSIAASPNEPPILIDAKFLVNALSSYQPKSMDDGRLFLEGKEMDIEHEMYPLIHTGLLKLHMSGMLYIKRDKWRGDVPPPVPTPESTEASKSKEESKTLEIDSKTPQDFAPNDRQAREQAPSPPAVPPGFENLNIVRQALIQEKKEEMRAVEEQIARIQNRNAQVDSEGNKFLAGLPLEDDSDDWNSEDTDPDSDSSDNMEAGPSQQGNSTQGSVLDSEGAIIQPPLRFKPHVELQKIQNDYRLWEASKAKELEKMKEIRERIRKSIEPDVPLLLQCPNRPDFAKAPVPKYKTQDDQAMYRAKNEQILPDWVKAGHEYAKQTQRWQAVITQGRAAEPLLEQESLMVQEAIKAKINGICQELVVPQAGKAEKAESNVLLQENEAPAKEQQLPSPEDEKILSPILEAMDEGEEVSILDGTQDLESKEVVLSSPPITPEMVMVLPVVEDQEMTDV